MRQKFLTPKAEWQEVAIGEFLTAHSEKVGSRDIEPVAVGVMGIRKRSEIYAKELSEDYSGNKVLRVNQICFGMGTREIVYAVLLEDAVYCVSPAYKIFNVINIEPLIIESILMLNNKKLSERYMIVSARQGKSVDFSNLVKEIIQIPSNAEQRKIVSILLGQQQLIDKNELLLAKVQQQQKHLIENLLTGKVPVKITGETA